MIIFIINSILSILLNLQFEQLSKLLFYLKTETILLTYVIAKIEGSGVK